MAYLLPSFVRSLFFFSIFKTLTLSADQSAKTYIFRIDGYSKPSIFVTHYHWYSSKFTNPLIILQAYNTVFHGFSASLIPSQATAILQHSSILAAFEDRRRHLHTTGSLQFLGLRNQQGLWAESNYGSDVIVGVFDIEIWPEQLSFSDMNMGPVPRRRKGVCQESNSLPEIAIVEEMANKLKQIQI